MLLLNVKIKIPCAHLIYRDLIALIIFGKAIPVAGRGDVEVLTLSRQLAHRWRWGCQPYAPAGRTLPPETYLVLISVRGWVDTRPIMWLERVCQLNPVTSSGMEPATFWLVAQFLNQLRYRGRAIAEAVSRWLPTAVARVRARVWHVGFVVDKVAWRQVFSEYFGFTCQNRSFQQLLHSHNHPRQVQ
jgi:hypothetical protein